MTDGVVVHSVAAWEQFPLGDGVNEGVNAQVYTDVCQALMVDGFKSWTLQKDGAYIETQVTAQWNSSYLEFTFIFQGSDP